MVCTGLLRLAGSILGPFLGRIREARLEPAVAAGDSNATSSIIALPFAAASSIGPPFAAATFADTPDGSEDVVGSADLGSGSWALCALKHLRYTAVAIAGQSLVYWAGFVANRGASDLADVAVLPCLRRASPAALPRLASLTQSCDVGR